MEKIIKLYKTIAQCPSLTSAKIIRKSAKEIIVESKWSQRNLERTTSQKFKVEHLLTNDFQVVSSSFPSDVTSELASETTRNNNCRAVLRSVSGKEKENAYKQFIEIWDKQRLIKNYDLTALDVHGEVYTDSEFGSLQWSPDSTRLLYIAEKKLPKSEPFYKQKAQDKKSEKGETDEPTKGNEYIYKPDWGEALVGKHQQVVVVLDTKLDTIKVIPVVDESLSPGQVIWTPNGNGVIGIAWKHEPRYLGLVACTNRESWIFSIENENFKKLSADNCGVRSPRFSPDGKKLIWLERDLSGPHHQAHRMMVIDWESDDKVPNVLIDVVETNLVINNDDYFYGLYNRELPRRCWSNDSKYIFLSTPQRSNVRSYVFNTQSRMLTEITNDNSSLMILDVVDKIIVFLNTSLLIPPKLLISKFEGETTSLKYSDITEAINFCGDDDLMYESCEYLYENDDEVKEFNFTYLGPKSGEDGSVPLIIVPHGGPHANYANTFSLEYALLASLGYAVVLVNYRGSTGMGAKNVEYLQGKVGDADVKDCVTATKEALKKYLWLDSNRVGLSGGSHGGFLVTHLSGQYASMFKAVVARNPVIDIAAMFTISDIPDCRNALTKDERIRLHHNVCAAVTNQSYNEVSVDETEEMFLKMFKCSPIVHAQKVKAPTLMLIGKNDLRVPPSQGTLWYHRLKANGVKTKMLVYDDNHPLSTGTVEIDEIINAILWFDEYLQLKVGDHLKSD